MNTVDEMLDEVFDGRRTALYREFGEWVRRSRRFKAFVMANRSKIRAKLKNAHDEETMRDLRAEFEVAAHLLGEERFAVEYEKFAALKQRGPDFTVTFKTHTPFNVEVRRLRTSELLRGDALAREVKLVEVLCDKAGQMAPNMTNILWLAAGQEVTLQDVAAAAALLRELAERKEEEFFVRRDYASAADFLRHYRRLSAVVLRRVDGTEIWHNSVASHRLAPEIANALVPGRGVR